MSRAALGLPKPILDVRSLEFVQECSPGGSDPLSEQSRVGFDTARSVLVLPRFRPLSLPSGDETVSCACGRISPRGIIISLTQRLMYTIIQ